MAVIHTDPDAPAFVREAINLADARLGAAALSTSDDFFAAKERMLDPAPAVFVPGKYDANGKWMDGWESRRKRGAGHDWCIVRLARPGRIVGADLDTSHFTGNFPPAASIEACRVDMGDPDPHTAWTPLLAPVNLRGNSHHYHAIDSDAVVTHVRVNLFPDGGLARLRLYGRPVFDPSRREDGRVDLVAAEQGGRVVAANNEHFGHASNLLLPGRGVNMGDGWETRRRREPGNDWCILALAQPGNIEQVEVDTAFFKGNYPDRCSLQAARVIGASEASLTTQSMFWTTLLPEQKLSADSIHTFEGQIVALGAVSHVRFNIFPDGGVSRLRLRGRPV